MSDRREGERRCLAASTARAGALVAIMAVAGTPPADAQIYTRKNSRGVTEATNIPQAPDFRLTYRGKGKLIHSRAYLLRPSYNGEFNHHIQAAAALYGVSVSLVRAVIQVESDFDPRAISTAGARGLMQLMPFTAERFGVRDAFDPRQNIFAGVQYLRFLLDLFQGDVTLATAAYNAGENAVLRYAGIPPFEETRTYVEKIQHLLTGSGGLPASPESGPASPKPRQKGPPQLWYRWQDTRGVYHVAQAPPTGIPYTTIRIISD